MKIAFKFKAWCTENFFWLFGRKSRINMSARPISETEAAVIERALAVASIDESSATLSRSVRSLTVISRCACGCATVDFLMPTQDLVPRIVTDAVAMSPSGEDLGLIVFAIDNEISCLELYSYSDNPAPLPVLDSISGYDNADM